MREHPDIEEPPPWEEVFFSQLVHGFLKDISLNDEADAKKGKGHAPVKKEADDHEGIKKHVAEGVEAQQEFMKGLIIFCSIIVTGLLAEPLGKCFLGFGQSEGIRIDHDGGIFFCGHLIYKEVVITAGYM